ncbi:hypothetical protein JW933_01355 [candidate division FCPU426 bacterium]|nr:hypothetical protein [candidate division FCPU426 bacterium]
MNMRTMIQKQELSLLLPWGIWAVHLGMAFLAIGLKMPQWLTGTLVNALLLSCLFRAGWKQAVLLGMITPLIATSVGVLPLPIIFMLPLIALANAGYVLVFDWAQAKSVSGALLLSAFLKFGLLFIAVTWLTFTPPAYQTPGGINTLEIPAAIKYMMTWPQLFTALAGGAMVLGLQRLAARLGEKK